MPSGTDLDADPRVDSLTRCRKRRARTHHGHAFLLAILVGLVLAAGAGATVAGVFVDNPAALVRCDLGSQHVQALGRTTFVAASDGSRLGAVPSTRHREPIPLARMSPWLAKATVAVEDARFWTRRGALDPEAITRAAIANIRAGRIVEGGSTLDQQLARDRYLRKPAPTISRKLQEACLAAQLERRYSRGEILEDYLDEAYYGHLAYGVQAAAETYFSRPAGRLTMAQAALLAGLPQAPTVYDPIEHPAAARRRRHEVLAALRTTGVISAARYRAADRWGLHLHPGARYSTAGPQPFFEYARRELIHRVGRWRAMHGGLKVTTTLEPHLQRLATVAIRNWLGQPGQPAAALVAIDPSSGAIRAMSAVAPGHQGDAFNLASQSHRQAGSTFKTFTLTAAMEAGIPLSSVWKGPPSLTIPDRRCLNGIDTPWVVHNYADEAHGTMSLLQATAFSVNTIFAQVITKVGPQAVVDVAHRMGIESPLEPVCSLTLGPEGVSPLEMADAFATLAARGIHHTASSLAQVSAADGKTVVDGPAQGDRAVSQSVADRVTYALSGVIRAGTGIAADIGRPAAGKTGTAESFKDAWFCGFVPQLATCVWMGYPQAEVPLGTVDGFSEVVGGSVPARIWHDFMTPALAGTPVKPLPTAAAGRLHGPSLTTTPPPTATTTQTRPKL